MVIFGKDSEDLTKRDIKFLIGSFTVITAATVIGLYLYNDIFKMHWTRRNSQEYYGQMNLLDYENNQNIQNYYKGGNMKW